MKSLKLNKLSEQILKDKQMNQIRGGEWFMCTCGCQYANNGGSSIEANRDVNCKAYKVSTEKETYACWNPK